MLDKYVVLHVEGGLGKNIAATALTSQIKKKYSDRKLIVVAAWPEVFLNNPHVYRVYRVGVTPYFYDDYIKDKDAIVLRKEPYFENDHIMRHTPLMETWFNMYDIPYKKGENYPTLPMNMLQAGTINIWKRNKPTLLLHTNGGPYDDKGQPHSYSWTRDIPTPIAVEIVNSLKDKYHIFQLCRKNSYNIPGAEIVNKPMSNYELFGLLCSTNKRILIDSCMQHAAAAYKLKSTVLWIGTVPEMFGYDLHTNIKAKKSSSVVKNIDAYIFDYDFQGQLHQCPYSDASKMFNTKEIIKTL
tara:strand:+ start:537 stop:1430 length:894 start_codon:yes stop_codon:yes gene_type:complete